MGKKEGRKCIKKNYISQLETYSPPLFLPDIPPYRTLNTHTHIRTHTKKLSSICSSRVIILDNWSISTERPKEKKRDLLKGTRNRIKDLPAGTKTRRHIFSVVLSTQQPCCRIRRNLTTGYGKREKQ